MAIEAEEGVGTGGVLRAGLFGKGGDGGGGTAVVVEERVEGVERVLGLLAYVHRVSAARRRLRRKSVKRR